MSNESYVGSSFKTEAHEGTSVGEKFDVLKGKFISLKLTEAVSDRNKDKVGEKTGEFFETFSRGYESVEDMEEIARDNNKLETQKQFAMNDLDLLGKVVYDTVRSDEKFKSLIGSGNASEIDENLPKEFKGIGKVVLTNVFEDGPVLETLRELDESRMGLRRMPEGEVKEKRIKEMVNKTIRKLANMENLTPGQNYDKEMSLGYLGTELEDGKTEKTKSEKREEASEKTREPETEKNEDKKENKNRQTTEIETAKTPEEQLVQVRKILDYIESQPDLDNYYTVGQYVSQLETELNNMSKEVGDEVRTRLKLKHCDYLMGQSGGWIDNPNKGMTMSIAAETAENKKRALGREDIKFLFNPKGANGMPVAKAWDLLQDASYGYGGMLDEIARKNKILVGEGGKEIEITEERMKQGLKVEMDNDPELGTVGVNFSSDKDIDRKNWVRNEIIERLANGIDPKIDRSEAKKLSKKALYLAESLALSTQEIAVWNRGTLLGNNELADMVGIQYYREQKDLNGRPIGPRYHMSLIKNIGATSWLRYTTTMGEENRILPGTKLNSEEVYKNLDKFGEGGYQYFFSVYISNKIYPLFGLLKQRDPSPKDTNYELLKKAVDYFNKADPRALVAEIDAKKQKYFPVETEGEESFVIFKTNDGRTERIKTEDGKKVFFNGKEYPIVLGKNGKEQLRALWLAGVVQMATTNPLLDWNLDSIMELGRMASEQKLSEEAGTFITKRQWNDIMRELDVYRNIRKLSRQRRIRGNRSKDFVREA